ncbi:hypothetical protein MNBD_UNCLBAC01-1042 [hydrothermal vent metagenome]|uniref:Uncharacterized protein n=1 Tax=hydrothermal vent metagenome TaxID=652676 RepID=A0A3B1DV69_9ZZZZ
MNKKFSLGLIILITVIVLSFSFNAIAQKNKDMFRFDPNAPKLGDAMEEVLKKRILNEKETLSTLKDIKGLLKEIRNTLNIIQNDLPKKNQELE